MPNYHYKVTLSGGGAEEGDMVAEDKFALAAELKNSGKTVISVKEVEEKKSGAGSISFNFLSKVKLRDKILFFRNLSSMIVAGLPLSRALTVLEKQTSKAVLKKVIHEVNENIMKGQTLSDSLLKYPKHFSTLETSMIHVGEESGNLAESLNTMAAQLEKSFQLKKKIKSAMMYPSIIFSVMIVIGILMFMFVVPALTATFKDLGTELPASTQFIITLSDALKGNPFMVLAVFAGVIFGIMSALKTAIGKKIFDFVSLRLPVISVMVKEYNTAQITRTLSSLLSSGVGVVESIHIAGDVLQNFYYKKVLLTTIEDVQKGVPLSDSFVKNENLFPMISGAMIQVGEETGQLSDMLRKIAEYYEEEVDTKTKDLSTIIEPLLMVIIGAAVGFFAISMISPMYSVMSGL
jgi:type IV pilus assembly protein PilC